MVAFEYDCENVQNDNDEDECKESLYIFDDAQKIYRLEDEDGIKFNVAQTIDFSAHDKVKEVKQLWDTDWTHVHITSRALTFGGEVYNLNTHF